MVQELLGDVVEDKKISNMPTRTAVDSSPTTSPPQSAASSPSSAAASENLRCPRCDSSNTKFCYYNNYNLTQPRHFCKTCRRYWTKGGALRNVPIGGGCRKTKVAAASAVPGCKPTRPTGELQPDVGRVGPGGGHGVDHDLLQCSPILWGGCSMQLPHSSHLLALLRASQVPQNHSQSFRNSIHIKEEAAMVNAPGIFDPFGQFSSNQYQNQNLFLGDAPTALGIQELYQRLRYPANCSSNNDNVVQMISSNVGAGSSSAAATATMTTTTTASILEPMPLVSGGEFGYWNPGLPWADIPLPNGAFP